MTSRSTWARDRRALGMCMALGLLGGCETFEIEIRTFAAADADLTAIQWVAPAPDPVGTSSATGRLLEKSVDQALKRYVTRRRDLVTDSTGDLISDTEHPLLRRRIATAAAAALRRRGVQVDEQPSAQATPEAGSASPGALLEVRFRQGPFVYVVPEEYHSSTSSYWVKDRKKRRRYYEHRHHHEYRGEHSRRGFAVGIAVSLLPADPGREAPLWQGIGVAVGRRERFDLLVPYLLEQVLDEFPVPTTRPPLREIDEPTLEKAVGGSGLAGPG